MDDSLTIEAVCKQCWQLLLLETVEIRADMDRMALYDANHAIENEMYTRHHFDWSHPNEIPIGVMNIRVMSIRKCPMPIALKLYSIVRWQQREWMGWIQKKYKIKR